MYCIYMYSIGPNTLLYRMNTCIHVCMFCVHASLSIKIQLLIHVRFAPPISIVLFFVSFVSYFMVY